MSSAVSPPPHSTNETCLKSRNDIVRPRRARCLFSFPSPVGACLPYTDVVPSICVLIFHMVQQAQENIAPQTVRRLSKEVSLDLLYSVDPWHGEGLGAQFWQNSLIDSLVVFLGWQAYISTT